MLTRTPKQVRYATGASAIIANGRTERERNTLARILFSEGYHGRPPVAPDPLWHHLLSEEPTSC